MASQSTPAPVPSYRSALDEQALRRISKLAGDVAEKEVQLDWLQKRLEKNTAEHAEAHETRQQLNNEIKALNTALFAAKAGLQAATTGQTTGRVGSRSGRWRRYFKCLRRAATTQLR